MKPLVIYHHPCADGLGAAWAARTVLGDDAEYLGMNYNAKAPLEQVVDRDVYILDFSFEPGIMQEIIERASRAVWLDHHKTAFEMWCGRYNKGDYYETGTLSDTTFIRLDDNQSGAVLAWEFFHPDKPVPVLLQYVQDYDLWHKVLPQNAAFTMALRSYPLDFVAWDHLAATVDTDVGFCNFVQEGQGILRYYNQQLTQLLRGGKRRVTLRLPEFIAPHGTRPVNEVSGLAVNANAMFTSEAGHRLAQESGTFGLVWHQSASGRIYVNLRSNGEYDVSEIAKAFGGGGHRNAAGFQVYSTDAWVWERAA